MAPGLISPVGGEVSVKPFFCARPRGDSLVESVVSAKEHRLPAMSYSSFVSTASRLLSNTLNTKHIVPVYSGVASVLRLARKPQVCDPVVRAVSVDVVDLVAGPFPVNVQPCEPMQLVGLPSDLCCEVSLGIEEPDNQIMPSGVAIHLPFEHPSLRGICEKVEQFFARNIHRKQPKLMAIPSQGVMLWQ